MSLPLCSTEGCGRVCAWKTTDGYLNGLPASGWGTTSEYDPHRYHWPQCNICYFQGQEEEDQEFLSSTEEDEEDDTPPIGGVGYGIGTNLTNLWVSSLDDQCDNCRVEAREHCEDCGGYGTAPSPSPPPSPPHTERAPTPPPLYEEIDTSPPPPLEEPKVQSFVCATFEPTRFIYNTNGLDLDKYEYYVKWGTLYVEVAPDDIREFSAIREEEDDMKRPIKTAHFNEDEIDEGEHWE